MKTQINILQRGNTQQGIYGTNREVRMETARKVERENPDGMTIEVGGRRFNLSVVRSQSGNLTDYISEELPREVLEELLPNDGKLARENGTDLVSGHLRINGDMTCEYLIYRRRSPMAQWKYSRSIILNERQVTIL